MSLHYKTEYRNNIAIIYFFGRFTGEHTTTFRSFFNRELKKSDHFIFSFYNLTFIDSSGIGTIVSTLERVVRQNGEIKLVSLRGEAAIIFEITRVYRIFDIFDDLEAAIESFGEIKS